MINIIFQDYVPQDEFIYEISAVDLIIVLAISIGVAIWIYFDARRRGINPKPWIILTILIWILGLVGYLAFRRQFIRQQSTDPNLISNDPRSQEAHTIQMNESLQGAFLLQKTVPSGEYKKEQKKRKYCGQCGASISSHSIHCPICGTRSA